MGAWKGSTATVIIVSVNMDMEKIARATRVVLNITRNKIVNSYEFSKYFIINKFLIAINEYSSYLYPIINHIHMKSFYPFVLLQKQSFPEF